MQQLLSVFSSGYPSGRSHEVDRIGYLEAEACKRKQIRGTVDQYVDIGDLGCTPWCSGVCSCHIPDHAWKQWHASRIDCPGCNEFCVGAGNALKIGAPLPDISELTLDICKFCAVEYGLPDFLPCSDWPCKVLRNGQDTLVFCTRSCNP